MNLEIALPDVDSKAYILGPVRAIVDSGKLGQFVSSDVEAQFLTKNYVTTVFAPLLEPGSDGYNSGNYLLGLLRFMHRCLNLGTD